MKEKRKKETEREREADGENHQKKMVVFNLVGDFTDNCAVVA